MKVFKEKTIGIDTMVFIYHVEDHPDYSDITERILGAVETGKNDAVTSVITLLEILVKPKKDGNTLAVRDYKDLLLTFPNLKITDVTVQIAKIASDLRAKYGIRTPDAIQIASTIKEGSGTFVTNDESLKKVEEVEVVLLDDLRKTL